VQEPLIDKWKRLVSDRQRERGDVDSGQDRDWFDMAYGFALAHEMQPEQAYDFALDVMHKGLM